MRLPYLSVCCVLWMLNIGCERVPESGIGVGGSVEALPPGVAVKPKGTQPPTAISGVAPALPVPAVGSASAGGMTWTATAPLVARRPNGQMRAAEYGVAGAAGPAEMTVFYFGAGSGGSVQKNLDRWIGQIKQADGSDSKKVAKIDELVVGDIKVTRLDVSGAYGGGRPMGPATAPVSDQRMLGAIAEGPKGSVFFKLLGPAETVASAEPAFVQMIKTFAPQ